MDARAETDIAIVGAGPAGVMLAQALVRPPAALDVTLIDPSPCGSPAFRAPEALALNTPAADMSLQPASPDGFVDWLRTYRHRPEGWSGRDFAPRLVFADYLRHSLDSLTGRTPGLGATRVRPARALAAEPVDGGWNIRLAGRESLRARTLVLAPGPARPRPLLFHGREQIEGFVQDDPWDHGELRTLPIGAQVLLIGSGLTALDVATAVWARDPTARITAVSRHGLLPRIHSGPNDDGPALKPPYPATARELYAKLRGEGEFVEGEAGLRPGVFRNLRAAAPRLWRNFSEAERAMFLRHFRRYWDVERHRIPPAQAAVAAAALADGRLRIVRGRLAEGKGVGSGLKARVALVGPAGPEALTVSRVVNCTGPEADPFRSRNPLILDLLSQGAAAADPLGLGLQVDDDCAVLNGAAAPTPGLFALGALTQGRFFEATAVPEIRAQAEALAERLIPELRPRRARQGHFTKGGMELRIDSTLPPVFSPKVVPRS